MKVVSLADAQAQFSTLCQSVITGEVIRVQFPSGAEMELRAVQREPDSAKGFTDEELAKSYDDPEWSEFENNCGKASD